MSNMLINEPPLMFSPTLAKELGSIEAAVFMQQLHFWLSISKHEHDGRPWIYNNADQCVEMMRNTVSKRTIERIISNLKKLELIDVQQLHSNKWNKTSFFTINYSELAKIDQKYSSKPISEHTAKVAESKTPKWRNRRCQSGGIEDAKVAESLQKNTTEDNTQNTSDSLFEEFWKCVPNKDGKKSAQSAFKKAIKKIPIEDLIIAYRANIQVCESQNRFKKNPATWLNQECWNDESIQNLVKQLKDPQLQQQATDQPTLINLPHKPKGLLGDNQ